MGERWQQRVLKSRGFGQAALNGQRAAQRQHGFEQSCSGFIAQVTFAQQASHLQFALCLLPVRGSLLPLGVRQWHGSEGGLFERKKRAAGAGGLGDEAEFDEPLQSFVGCAIDNLHAHWRKRVRLAGAEVFLVQAAQALAPFGGVSLHHQVEDGVIALMRIALLAADQRAVDALASLLREAQRAIRRQHFAGRGLGRGGLRL